MADAKKYKPTFRKLGSIDAQLARGKQSNSGYTSKDYGGSVTNVYEDPEIFQSHLNNTSVTGGLKLRPGSGALANLNLDAFPKERSRKIQRSLEWLDDDLLGALVNVKQDFTIAGFNIRCRPPEGSNVELLEISDTIEVMKEPAATSTSSKDNGKVDQISTVNPAPMNLTLVSLQKLTKAELEYLKLQTKFQRKINLISRKWDFRAIARELLKDWYATDSMILYWKIEVDEDGEPAFGPETRDDTGELIRNKEGLLPGVTDITALSPADVDWDNSLGNDRLKVRIPEAVEKRILAAIHRDKKRDQRAAIAQLIEDGIQKKWIDAVINGEKFVELRNEDGDFWIIRTKNKRHMGLASPSMSNIFMSLETRRTLTEGDFTAAFMMKHFIMHVKAGESIQSGDLAGRKDNWAKKEDTDALLAIFTQTSKSMRICTNHTVKVEFIYPPKEMFDPVKYANCEGRIYNWAGITVQIMNSEKGTFNGAFVGIKKLIASIGDARSEINWVFAEFFDDPNINSICQVPQDCDLAVIFDENMLKEPRQLLDEITFMVTQGIMDVRSAARELGRDPDSMKLGKIVSLAENAATDVWNPIVGLPGGNSAGAGDIPDKGGRPPNDDTVVSEETRQQYSSAS